MASRCRQRHEAAALASRNDSIKGHVKVMRAPERIGVAAMVRGRLVLPLESPKSVRSRALPIDGRVVLTTPGVACGGPMLPKSRLLGSDSAVAYQAAIGIDVVRGVPARRGERKLDAR